MRRGINEQARDMENERLRLPWYNLNHGPFMTTAQSRGPFMTSAFWGWGRGQFYQIEEFYMRMSGGSTGKQRVTLTAHVIPTTPPRTHTRTYTNPNTKQKREPLPR